MQLSSDEISAAAIDILSLSGRGPSEKIIIFSEAETAGVLQAACRDAGVSEPVIATYNTTQSAERRSQSASAGNVDFVDRLKIITQGKGFPIVIVATPRPEAVRMALGCAAVFGEVYLLYAPSGPVKADLNSTVNYKSLEVIGIGHRA